MQSERTDEGAPVFEVDAETVRKVRDGRLLGWSVGVHVEERIYDEPVPIVCNPLTWLEEPDAPQPE